VEQLVKYAIQFYGSGKYESPQMTVQPHEAHLLKLDISKAISELGWKPRMQSTVAIEQTIKWYKEAGKADAARLTLQQILEYQQS
jgi:CDP-glucose 4,6-dehydratase